MVAHRALGRVRRAQHLIGLMAKRLLVVAETIKIFA